jgi:cation:H+ antiporter
MAAEGGTEPVVALSWLLLQFAACAAVIARSGYVLSRSADALAEAHGWGRGWVGLALLATVTSLPELSSGISAVAVVGEPNLAVGNALGACVVNLLFLVVVDALQRNQPLYREASSTHLLSAGFGAVMLGFVALSVLTGGRVPAVLHVGLYSPMLLGLYLLALKAVHGQEQRVVADAEGERAVAAPGAPGVAGQIRREWVRFGLAACGVLIAGTWMPDLADDLAQTLGLSRSFIGTVFMAIVTTLPEMAVTLGALRLGALDMGHRQPARQQPVQCRDPGGGRCVLCSRSAARRRGAGARRHCRDGAGDDRPGHHRSGHAAPGAYPAQAQLGQRRPCGDLCRERGTGLSGRGMIAQTHWRAGDVSGSRAAGAHVLGHAGAVAPAARGDRRRADTAYCAGGRSYGSTGSALPGRPWRRP